MSPSAVAPHEDLTLDIPGLVLAARAWGPRDGLPVLALHGWLDNAGSFARLAPHLDGLRIVALDHAGHGLSHHRPRGSHYLFLDYVADTFAAADALGWTRFALLGHSMGAGIASLVAGTFPQRITRTVLIEGLGPWSGKSSKTAEHFAIALSRQAEFRARTPLAYPRHEALERIRRSRRGLSQEGARALLERAVEPDGDLVRFRHDPMLRAPSTLRLTERQVLSFLTRIEAPTRLIMAHDGWPLGDDLTAWQARRDAVRGLDHVTVDGYHHVHLDDPERIAPLVHSGLHP